MEEIKKKPFDVSFQMTIFNKNLQLIADQALMASFMNKRIALFIFSGHRLF